MKFFLNLFDAWQRIQVLTAKLLSLIVFLFFFFVHSAAQDEPKNNNLKAIYFKRFVFKLYLAYLKLKSTQTQANNWRTDQPVITKTRKGRRCRVQVLQPLRLRFCFDSSSWTRPTLLNNYNKSKWQKIIFSYFWKNKVGRGGRGESKLRRQLIAMRSRVEILATTRN